MPLEEQTYVVPIDASGAPLPGAEAVSVVEISDADRAILDAVAAEMPAGSAPSTAEADGTGPGAAAGPDGADRDEDGTGDQAHTQEPTPQG
jgi:hypothetical protein